jgi:hypothetical protein
MLSVRAALNVPEVCINAAQEERTAAKAARAGACCKLHVLAQQLNGDGFMARTPAASVRHNASLVLQ